MRLRRALIVGLCAAVPFIQSRVDDLRGRYSRQEEVLYFTTGEQVRRALPGFTDLMADLYWLRTVQYYGGQLKFAKRKHYDLLAPLVEITTTLDPHFEIAYRYGATFLCERYPAGAGQPELGLAVLEKGVHHNPKVWMLWQHLAFYAYFYGKDVHRAAAAAEEGARQPGAPDWLRTLAPELLRRGGDRKLAREIWQRLAESSESGGIRDVAQLHLRVIAAADGAEALNQLVARFKLARGRSVTGWQDLRDAGYIRHEPRDPAGVPYRFDAATDAFLVNRESPLWRE